jgi:hypothetical protein
MVETEMAEVQPLNNLDLDYMIQKSTFTYLYIVVILYLNKFTIIVKCEGCKRITYKVITHLDGNIILIKITGVSQIFIYQICRFVEFSMFLMKLVISFH